MNFAFKRGFTLIELLVVIAIIGLLSSIVFASVSSARDKAKSTKAISDMRNIYQAFNLWTVDNDPDGILNAPFVANDVDSWHYPDCDGIQNVGSSGNDWPNAQTVNYFSSYLVPDYIQEIPDDPWGNNYIIDASYNCSTGTPSGCISGNGWQYVIHSGGPNGSGLNAYDSDNIIYAICKHG